MFSRITNSLAVASAFDELPSDWTVLDVRGLIDGPGNSPDLIEEYVASGLRIVAEPSQKLIVVCDYGQSRSNFIAARIHATRQEITLSEAIEAVRTAHPDSQIKPAFLNYGISLRAAPSITRVAISGGNGLIGRRLTEEFATLGVKCQVLTRQQHGKYLEDSNALRAAIGRTRPDLFIHLAHPKPLNSESTLKDALSQLITVVNYCEDDEVSLVYPSSWTVFDGSTDAEVTSSSCVAPHTRYGRLKAMIETYVTLSSNKTLDAKIIRLPGLFGQDSLEPRFLRYFAQCATKRQEIIFHQFINGSARVPLVDADTCAHWLAKSLNEYRSLPALSHLGYSTPTPTISEIATAVAKRAGIVSKGVSIERKAFIGHFCPDIIIPRETDASLELEEFITGLSEDVK